MANANRTLLYMGAAACTGIAGILHLMLVPGSIIAGIEYATFFVDFWSGTALLGFADGKEMG